MYRVAGRGKSVVVRRSAFYLLLVIPIFLLSAPLSQVHAQTPELVTGLHYYAIENLDRGTVERRGTTGTIGIAFNNLVVAPSTRYRIWVLEATTLEIGRLTLTTGLPGRRVDVPAIELRPHEAEDFDADGLTDLAEFIIGTDQATADTDGDGILDGAEVTQGLNPLDGLSVITGIVRSLALAGPADDVCVNGDLLVVAHGKRITGVNIFAGLSPAIVFTLALGGRVNRVACSGDFVVAVAGDGISIVNASDPGAAFIAAHINDMALGGKARAVTAATGIAYVGLDDGDLVSIDLQRAVIADRLDLGTEILGLASEGSHLYAATAGALHVVPLVPVDLHVVGNVELDASGTGRLFVGGRTAYVTDASGFSVVDVTMPGAPALILHTLPGSQIRDIALNGSGVAATLTPIVQDVGFYNVTGLTPASDPLLIDRFLFSIPTPGEAWAVEIANGLAYVADGSRGLQVINYLAFDTAGVPPGIALIPEFDVNGVSEGTIIGMSVSVSDDVQVRSVEFVVNGEATTDSTFPFEHRFLTPRLDQQTSVRIRARAFDTGGNFTWTEEIEVPLTPDDSPPHVVAVSPHGSAIAPISHVVVFVDELLDEATLTPSTFSVAGAGPDALSNTADDIPVSGAITFQPALFTATLTPPAELAPGLYRARFSKAITDAAGNAFAADKFWSFRVYANTDVNGDGVGDGAGNSDGDVLLNAYEIALGLNPLVSDFGPTRDADDDGLTDLEEFVLGTDPLAFDSDLDGFSDADEVGVGSDPLDPTQGAFLFAFGFASVQGFGYRPVFSSVGLLNEAAPEAVAGKTEVQVLSVENEESP